MRSTCPAPPNNTVSCTSTNAANRASSNTSGRAHSSRWTGRDGLGRRPVQVGRAADQVRAAEQTTADQHRGEASSRSRRVSDDVGQQARHQVGEDRVGGGERAAPNSVSRTTEMARLVAIRPKPDPGRRPGGCARSSAYRPRERPDRRGRRQASRRPACRAGFARRSPRESPVTAAASRQSSEEPAGRPDRADGDQRDRRGGPDGLFRPPRCPRGTGTGGDRLDGRLGTAAVGSAAVARSDQPSGAAAAGFRSSGRSRAVPVTAPAGAMVARSRRGRPPGARRRGGR